MTTERFVTRGSTSLAASIEADDLSITVQSTTRFPTQPEFRIGVGQELMLVTGVSGATWTVTRGIEGTTPTTHSAGASVVAVLTAGGLDELRTEIEAEIPQNTVQTSDPRLSDDRTASGIRTSSTVVAVSAAAAPTAGQVLTATSGTAAQWVNPITERDSDVNYTNVLSSWVIRTSAADNSWRSVTHGNGLFVATSIDGVGNRVMTSPDGINWTIRTSAADNNWGSVVFGNGLFVAVSTTGTGNRVMTANLALPSANAQQGTFVLNGATPVAVAFTGITASNFVVVTPLTRGGTPGAPPIVTISAGVGFSVVGIALDTSTYSYRVI
jgi:hypothetical protein